MVYVLPKFTKSGDDTGATKTAEATPPQTPTPPPVETPPPPVETPPVANGSEVEVATPPVATPPVETPPVETPPVETPATKPTTKPETKPTTKPGHAVTKPTTKPDVETPPVETKPEVKPTTKPAHEEPVDDDCDETSCILTKYAKACCEKYKPTSSDLAARTGGGLPEELDKMMVRAGVEKVKPRIVKCGEKAAAVKGTVKIAMTVSPAGSVTSADVAETPDAGLGTCVLAAMKAASFGKSVNGGSFTYPFVF